MLSTWIGIAVTVILWVIGLLLRRHSQLTVTESEKLARLLAVTNALAVHAATRDVYPTAQTPEEVFAEAKYATKPVFDADK